MLNVRKRLVKKLIPKKLDILVLIFIGSIIFGIILGKIINNYKLNHFDEEYFFKDSENNYYLRLKEDSKCEFKDSLRDNLNCNYEVVREDDNVLVEFKLILDSKDDQEVYTYYNCYRQVDKSSETRGSYNLVHCSNDTVNYEDEFTLYTK